MRSIMDSKYEEENINSATINAIVNNGKKDFTAKLDLVSEDGMRKVVFREGNRFIVTDSYLRMYDALEDITQKLMTKGMILKTCQNCQHFSTTPDGTLDCLNGKCNISQNEILIWNGCQYFHQTNQMHLKTLDKRLPVSPLPALQMKFQLLRILQINPPFLVTVMSVFPFEKL